MTVYEAVKKYELEGYGKHYTDVCGTPQPFLNLKELPDYPVREVRIDLKDNRADIALDIFLGDHTL